MILMKDRAAFVIGACGKKAPGQCQEVAATVTMVITDSEGAWLTQQSRARKSSAASWRLARALGVSPLQVPSGCFSAPSLCILAPQQFSAVSRYFVVGKERETSLPRHMLIQSEKLC